MVQVKREQTLYMCALIYLQHTVNKYTVPSSHWFDPGQGDIYQNDKKNYQNIYTLQTLLKYLQFSITVYEMEAMQVQQRESVSSTFIKTTTDI